MKYIYSNKISGEHKKWTIFILLFGILLTAWLPLSSFYFGMKNDAFSDNFPNKFFLSEAIHSGMNPLWNPYLNFGFPVYADLGFAFWNPITWLFAGIGYNAYTLTCEVLLYLFIAGISMFYLCNYLKFSAKTCLAVSCMYMCSGFFTGSVQYINFITGAAFLPAALLALLGLIEQPCLKNSFLLAVAWYMIIAGGHPAIPVGFAYFTVIFTGVFLSMNKGHHYKIKRIFFYAAIGFMMLLIFYLPAIYSYLNIFPFYARNHPELQDNQVKTGFTVSSFISFLLPFFTAVSKNIFSTDVAMRNAYFSISGFLLMLSAYRYKNKYTVSLIVVALFSLLISAGGLLKYYLYSNLPLLNYIRTNGEFRVFTILCFCILAGYGMEALFAKNETTVRSYKWSLYTVLTLAIITLGYLLIVRNSTITGDIHSSINAGSFAEKVKSLLGASAETFLFLSSSITLCLILLSLYALNRQKQTVIISVIILDLIINTLLYLPVTGVGQLTLSSIQSVYNSSPGGIPVPPLVPINEIKRLDEKTTGLMGDISYYNKKIGTGYLTDYPSYFLTTSEFFNNPLKDSILKNTFLFLKSHVAASSTDNILIKKYSPCNWLLAVQSGKEDSLFFLQNHYKYWKAYNNKKEVPVTKSLVTFMSIAIHPGQNDIEFIYSDRWLYIMIALSFTGFIICLFLFFTKWKKIPVIVIQ